MIACNLGGDRPGTGSALFAIVSAQQRDRRTDQSDEHQDLGR